MSVVYRAEDTRLNRAVALKILSAEAVAIPERKKRFIQEARTASALNHPDIMTVYDIDISDGIDFIAIEYVDGKTLGQLIGHRGLPLAEVLRYATEIADALTAAHTAAVVHRDLKPGNVIVSEKGRVKVLDFGLAKLSQQKAGGDELTQSMTREQKPQTEEGTIVGTVSCHPNRRPARRWIGVRISFPSAPFFMKWSPAAGHSTPFRLGCAAEARLLVADHWPIGSAMSDLSLKFELFRELTLGCAL